MRVWNRGGNRVCAVNFAIDEEALAILRKHSPNARGYGRFLARLLYEHEARHERQEIVEEAVGSANRTEP